MSAQWTITDAVVDQSEGRGHRAEYSVIPEWPASHIPVACDWLDDVRRQLQAIAALPAGWDSYGSPSPDVRVLEAAWGLLLCLCQAEGFPKPHVNPTPRGGVQFEWESGDRYFEIEVLTERAATYLYCDEAARTEEAGEVFEGKSLEPVLGYIRRVVAVQ